ncbi:hypothetical protein [Nonomuraea recticatena]|uniref:hypothetical protein n=1 Tax=Nonomuraea recticatena TaxID=46178 RepID=UPI003616698C
MKETPATRKRVRPYTKLYSSTIRDDRLSFRALGVLTLILDLPEDWVVRAEALAAGAGREGRDAVAKALRELAAAGYYRVERRRERSGRFSMGNAISDEPVASWAAEYVEFGGKPIPLVQQPDGSYMVLHADDSLTPDGFGPEHAGGQGMESPGQTGNGFSGSGEVIKNPGERDATGNGFSGSGSGSCGSGETDTTEHGKPGPGEPESGGPGPFSSTETENREVETPPVLAVGELTVVNAHAGEAPSAQPKNSFAGRSLIAAVPRYREAPGWAKARLADMATATLESFGRDAIIEFARTVKPGMFKDHQHVPEFRHALRLLGQAVALGHACRNCGRPPRTAPAVQRSPTPSSSTPRGPRRTRRSGRERWTRSD